MTDILVTPQILKQVAWENARNMGNIDDETALDIGYAQVGHEGSAAEVVTEAIKTLETRQQAMRIEAAGRQAGHLLCGDCFVDVKPGDSCGHISNKNGVAR